MMHLQSLEHAAGPDGASRELNESLRLLGAAVDESRRLISGLRPPTLDELGIIEAVESLVADARIDVPQVFFAHDLPSGRLAAQLETTIFRIVQESLSNARRHAGASRVNVAIEATDPESQPRVRVSIHDNGVGFDPAAVPDDRFGLEGIRQRARMLGSEAAIRSSPGQWTEIEVALPLLMAEELSAATDRFRRLLLDGVEGAGVIDLVDRWRPQHGMERGIERCQLVVPGE